MFSLPRYKLTKEYSCVNCSVVSNKKSLEDEIDPPAEYTDENVKDDDTWQTHGGDKSLVDTLEDTLAVSGINAMMYLPKKHSTSEGKATIIKSKRNDPRIDCEVFVDGKVKKFRFTVLDVTEVKIGKGLVNAIPNDIPASRCFNLMIKSKGELNFVMESERLRDDVCFSLAQLIERRGGKSRLVI
jgi:hypothetical protein